MAILPKIEGGYKFCPRCKKVYPVLTYFSKDKNRKDGYCFYCKLCMSELKKGYYKINKQWKQKKTRM